MIKVLLSRKVKAENYQRLLNLMREMRAAALHQPGYLTGETMVRGQDLLEVVAIGTWLSEECWKAWSTCRERIEIEDMIRPLLEGDLDAAVFRTPTEA